MISIVIPLYQNAHTLSRCLASIGEGCEIVVVDDGSTDTEALSLPAAVTYLRQEHQGAAAARNHGLEAATGDYVWFVDADDMLLPGAVQAAEEALRQQPCDMLKMGRLVTDKKGGKGEGTLDHTTYLYRRQFLLQRRLHYPEDMAILEDSVFVLRCLAAKPVLVYQPSMRFYRIYTRTTTAGRWDRDKRARFLPSIERFFDEFHRFVSLHPEHQPLYNRYAYVYTRVLIVKGCTPGEMLRFRRCLGHHQSQEDYLAQLHDQGITAITYDRLCQAKDTPRPLLMHLASLTDGIERFNRRREAALLDFAAQVKEALGLDTVVVKGSSLARYYPVPLHRECGDNDIYFGPQAPRVDAWLRSLGIEVDNRDPRHSSFHWKNIAFENHAYLLYPLHPGDTSLEPQWQTVRVGENILFLTPPYEALFVAAHAEHHALFHNEAANQRQLLDWCYLLPHLDYEAFNAIKRDRFGDLLTQYCVATYGSTPPQGWQPLSPRALSHFPTLFLTPQPRHPLALVRVARRSWKYLRYGRTYREIYGESPFRRFYLRNITHAIHQLLTGQQRAEGRQPIS